MESSFQCFICNKVGTFLSEIYICISSIFCEIWYPNMELFSRFCLIKKTDSKVVTPDSRSMPRTWGQTMKVFQGGKYLRKYLTLLDGNGKRTVVSLTRVWWFVALFSPNGVWVTRQWLTVSHFVCSHNTFIHFLMSFNAVCIKF